MEKKIDDIILSAKERIDLHKETINKLEKTGKHTLIYTPAGAKREPSQQVKREVDAIKKEIGKIQDTARKEIKEETKHLPEADQKKYLDKLQTELDAPASMKKKELQKDISFGGSFGMGLPKSFDDAATKKQEVDKPQSKFLKNDAGEKEK